MILPPRAAVPALLAVALSAPGCVGLRTASLVYPPPGEDRPAAPPAAAPGAPAVALRSVTDERRDDRAVVGTYVRVPQQEMPPVETKLVTADDAPAWVRAALRHELQLAGLSVVDAAAGGAPALDASIRRISCEASEDSRLYAGTAELRAVLGGPGGVLLDRTYGGRVRSAVAIGDDVTDEGIEACLAGALRDAAQRIAADAARALRPSGAGRGSAVQLDPSSASGISR